ncbi:hypothetical protein DN752_20960 [Echinicola strongylocentroti]|uniref:Uncharacterized protein n=1 Tax=Echinicola strongylocentroti TaxID=1795355 RepID=A0A2Z4IQ44_9BACT|nr:type IV secretion system DNA-binding domain-containing protein [Echinicola strongylocentroti]AWW32413.1 hypothetical protein DN752_20960 [Echinicola strongylocentroti]
MKKEIQITITGTHGSGKSKVAAIILEALKENGYRHVVLYPTPFAEERKMIWDDFHTIMMECKQEREEVTNG